MNVQINTSDNFLMAFHFEAQQWISNIQFMENELLFIRQLLNSYVFEANTPNLFERLREFKLKIKTIDKNAVALKIAIRKHENQLGGMLECDNISCDNYYADDHKSLETKFNEFQVNFQDFKVKVFNYARGILKKKKNTSQN